jgi:hypothetical protein
MSDQRRIFLQDTKNAVLYLILSSFGDELSEYIRINTKESGRGAILFTFTGETIGTLQLPGWITFTDVLARMLDQSGRHGSELSSMLRRYDPETEFIMLVSSPTGPNGESIDSATIITYEIAAYARANPGTYIDMGIPAKMA